MPTCSKLLVTPLIFSHSTLPVWSFCCWLALLRFNGLIIVFCLLFTQTHIVTQSHAWQANQDILNTLMRFAAAVIMQYYVLILCALITHQHVHHRVVCTCCQQCIIEAVLMLHIKWLSLYLNVQGHIWNEALRIHYVIVIYCIYKI